MNVQIYPSMPDYYTCPTPLPIYSDTCLKRSSEGHAGNTFIQMKFLSHELFMAEGFNSTRQLY